MKKIIIYIFLFFTSLCYSQDKDFEYNRGSPALGIINAIYSGVGMAYIEKKGEYSLSVPIFEFGYERDIHLYSSDKIKGFHLILSTGISIFGADGNYYSGEARNVSNNFLDIPIILTFEIDVGDIAWKISWGLYASALTYSEVRGEKLKIINNEDFPGYNFGAIFSLFGFSYKIAETTALKISMPVKYDFTQAYYKGSKVIRKTVVSINLGLEI